MLNAARRVLRRPFEHMVLAWDDAEHVWDHDDPLLDGWAPSASALGFPTPAD